MGDRCTAELTWKWGWDGKGWLERRHALCLRDVPFGRFFQGLPFQNERRGLSRSAQRTYHRAPEVGLKLGQRFG